MASRAAAIPQRVYSTGMLVAIGGMLMFFAALISAWIVRKGFAQAAAEVPAELPRLLLETNAAVLLASSFALEIGRRRLRAGDNRAFRKWWLVTLGMGVLFFAGQVVACARVRLQGGFWAAIPEASFFYVFVVAHAIHLLAGIPALAVALFRPLRNMTLETAARVCAIYWHFVTFIWIVIVALLLGA